MPGTRWKIYRVFNFILLACSSIIFLVLVRQFAKFRSLELAGSNPQIEIAFVFTCSVFLSMIISSLLNIIIMSKAFPDKLLTANQNRSHIFSIVLNVFAFAGLTLGLISLLNEIRNVQPGQMIFFMIMLAIVIVLLTLLIFIFISQVVLKKYLRSKNEVAVISMIDSIGKEN